MSDTNGTPRLPQDLKALRAERRRLEESVRIRQLQRVEQLQESYWGYDREFSHGLDWERIRPQWAPGQWLPPAQPGDRRHGQNWPLWQTETDLDHLRQMSRVLVAANAYARGLLRNLTNYIVRKGYTWKVGTKELGQTADLSSPTVGPEQIEQWAATAQDIVDEFRERCWTMQRQREAFRRTRRDGEAFLRYFPDDATGRLNLRFVEPECVRNPPGATLADGWSCGIRHQMVPHEDVETVEQYHLQYPDLTTAGTTGELVDGSEVLHIRLPDDDSALARGTPEFSYDTLAAFERAAKAQRNLSVGAAIRAAFVETWQYSTATRSQVQDFQAGFRSAQETDPETGLITDIQYLRPGQTRHVPKGREPVPPSPGNTQEHLAAVGGDLRQAAAAFTAPEYMTGDASNGNYSSLETASAPFIVSAESDQEYYKEQFTRPVWRALRCAVAAGRLPAQALTYLDVQCEGASPLHRNELEKAQRDTLLVNMEAKSPQTVAMEDGLDPEQEAANIEQHRQRFPQQPKQGQGQQQDQGGSRGGIPSQSSGLPDMRRLGLGESVLEGFTGVILDKLGREYHYEDGNRVKQPDDAEQGHLDQADHDAYTQHRIARHKAAPRPTTKPAANKWGTANVETEGGVSPDEKKALKSYQRESYNINDALRQGYTSKLPGVEDEIRGLDSVMERSRTKVDVVALRGVTGAGLRNLEPGAVYVDRGFVSTTVSHAGQVADGFADSPSGGAICEILVPEGSSAVYLKGLGEAELLLDRGSVFHVHDVSTDAGGRKRYRMTLVHQGILFGDDHGRTRPGVKVGESVETEDPSDLSRYTWGEGEFSPIDPDDLH